jgi:streptomycin 6-kinase
MVEIPADFGQGLAEWEGDAARDWVESLPALVDEFLQRWRCTPAAPITSGNVGIILPVRRHDGSAAVLKISFTHPGNRYEAHAFAIWAGRGAVLLYERDDAKFAMLLEQGEWQTLDDVEDVDQATAVVGRLARRLAVSAPPGLPRLTDQADDWEQTLCESAGRLRQPLSRRALDAAMATVQDLGRNQPNTMVHGDLHFGNVVRAHREPWLVIDPKGWVGDRAFDSITVLARGAESLRKADNVDAEVLRRLAIFADAAGIDLQRVVRWVQARAAIAARRRREDPTRPWIIPMVAHLADQLA